MTLKKLLTFCLLMTLTTAVGAQSVTWSSVMSALSKQRFALDAEHRALKDQLKIVEEQAKIQDEHVGLLKTRLAKLNSKLAPSSSEPTSPGIAAKGIPDAAPLGETTNYHQKESELLTRSAGRMIVLVGKDGAVGTAFSAPQEGKIRVFVSAQWIDKNPKPTVTSHDGTILTISEELGCAVGVDLVCLHPKATDLPHFELTGNNEKPMVGARVLVILVDPKTKQLKGVGGSIRGIGPDTLELDANLTPEMTGAPVLALESGVVIGIVAPQIAGVADAWAIGTRHQGIRNFAARIDRIKEWKTIDLGRFANEAAYIDGINKRTRIAWLAHMLVEHRLASTRNNFGAPPGMPPRDLMPGMSVERKHGESIEDYEKRRKSEREEYEKKREEDKKERERVQQFLGAVRKEARENAANPHIARVTSWLSEPSKLRGGQPGSADHSDRLAGIYRSILTDLKKQEPDLSDHMTWYHQQQYRISQVNRSEGIRVIAENANRVGQ